MLGARHPATAALGIAVADLSQAETALTALAALPALRKRRLLATFGSLMQ